jgi:PhoPQ-activated pathogenicity-related protein
MFGIQKAALVSLLLVAAAGQARADLDEYLAKPEPKFRWEKKGEDSVSGCKVYDLFMVSQEWQGKPWEHRIILCVPEKMSHPELCSLFNTGGKGGQEDITMAATMATKTGSPFAIVFGIPSQPLWNKTEDALVVYTWLKFVETMKQDGKGDETWPLHLPMAKAVIKAMDAIQAFAKENGLTPIEKFVVSGGSKRGWTAWLVGASKDKRVAAIAPMVIDVLNVPKQAQHQLDAYGKPSEQIMDYSMAGIGPLLKTAEGKRLMELEDPYSYRDRLTLPKLIVLGTNDRYWTQDALNLYWDDLKGPKWVIYVPNSGHKLEDRPRVFATLAAFTKAVAAGESLPKLGWKYSDQKGGGARLEITSDAKLVEARLFETVARTQDFRDSKWSFRKMDGEGTSWSVDIDPPAEGYRACYGEAVYEKDGARFTITTQIKILGGAATAPAPTPESSPAKKRWL